MGLLAVVALATAMLGVALLLPASAQAAATVKVVVDFEGYNLGQGFYVEPTLVEIPEGATVADATIELMGSRLGYSGSGTGFYVYGVRDADTGVVSVPAYITDNGGPATADAVDRGNVPPTDLLGEFDYSWMAGWMYTVNNVMPDVGAGAYELDEGDVVRWQFSLWGWGLDLGVSGWGGEGYFTMVDRTALMRAVVADDAVAIAKPAALDVIINPLATEAEVAAALAALQPAPEADKAALDAAIAEAQGKVEADYTAESWAALQTALTAAQAVAADPDATQAQVDEATADLNAAIDGLVPVPAVDLEAAYQDTGAFIVSRGTPKLGSVKGEWAVLGLARAGYDVPEGLFAGYLQNVTDAVIAADGVLSATAYTEYSRVILGLTSIGADVTNVGGYDLLRPLADYDKVVSQGINGAVFALLALDSHQYAVPDVSGLSTLTTRELLVDKILERELAGGGWTLFGATADVDVTAMALQALAPYAASDPEVQAAVDRGLAVLAARQTADGGFPGSWFGAPSSESIAQVIVALTALDLDPLTDARFIKNGNTLLDALLTFYVEGGGFKHAVAGVRDDMASEQAYYALAAYFRFANGQTSLYDMTDVVIVKAADKAALDAAIAEAQSKVEDDYTAESWAALQTALTAAQAVAADPDATQAQVDEATADLQAAIAALVPVPATHQVTVNLQPAQASIVILDTGGDVVGTGTSHNLLDGSYSYRAGAGGHLSASGSFTVSGAPVNLDVTLTPYAATGYNWTESTRGDSSNMAIINDPAIAAGVPTTLNESEVKWTTDSGTTTHAIFVNDQMFSASRSTLSKIDTSDGTRTTATLAGSIGFSYFITSGEGKIFIQEGQRVEAINAADMTQAWLSAPVSGGAQGLSRLYYADGFVYGGTTQSAGAVFFCMSAADGSIVWEKPWVKNPNTGGDTWSTYGYYWAGAVVIDDYAVFGGESGVLLSVDRLTGETVDVYNLPAGHDIRTSIAYDGDDLYFGVKQGGLVYKVDFDESSGELGSATSAKIDPAASETISTPVVHDGRVYVSASTTTGTRAVVGVLNAADLSHIYSVPLAADAGNATKGHDVLLIVDEANDCVYGYTTHYWTPGSMTCFRDAAGQTEPEYVDFSPLTQGVADQYGAAQIIVGPDGTLYFPNDTAKMIAVAKNSAYLASLSADTGTLAPAFASTTTAYTLVVPRGTASVDLSFAAVEGASVEVNGSASSGSASIALSGGTAAASIRVHKASYTRTYTVNIREASNDATLSDLKLSTSNAWNASVLATTPVFSPDSTYIVQTTEQPSRAFINLWPTTSDPNASVVVTAGAGIRPNGGSSGEPIPVAGTTAGHNRYAAYFVTAPQANVGIVTITVTAEDGLTTKTYSAVLVKNADTTAPTIDGVVATDLTVTVTATDDNLLAPRAYSFDGGATWQASNEKTFEEAGTLEPGTIRVRDAVLNVTQYDQAVTVGTPPVDKAALNAAIAEAQGKVEADYTAESWAALQTALTAAQAVAADPDATQAQVDEATADLNAAIAGLVLKADKAALDAAIREAQSKVEADYTAESWAALQTALTAAQAVAADPDATQAQVDEATADLNAAIAGLMFKPGDPVDTTISFQTDATGFLLAKKPVSVATDLSERYGYPDTYKGAQATSLDALVAAHIALFGDEPAVIHDKLTVTSSGFVTRFLGEDSSAFGFFINGTMSGDGNFKPDPYSGGTSQTGYTVSEAPLGGNDDVLFIRYQDTSYYLDLFAWFEADGQKTSALSVTAGENVTLTLKGYFAAWYGLSDPDWQAQKTAPIEEGAVVPVTLAGDAGMFGAALATTDTNGQATLSFAEPGTYVLSAIDASEYGHPLVSPWLTVTVTAAPLDKAALDAAIREAQGKVEADYTAESWAALQTALTAAQAVAADPDATQAQVDEATADLNAAISGLVPKRIVKVTKVKLPSAATVKAGQTITLTAKVSPEDATDKSLTWKSSNTKVATVDQNGVVTGVKPGCAVITARANDGSGKYDICRVTVKDSRVKVTKVKLPSAATVKAGQTITLTAKVSPEDATDKSLTWKSSNTKVATVDQNGVVTGVKPGCAVITARANDGSGKYDICRVTVKPAR